MKNEDLNIKLAQLKKLIGGWAYRALVQGRPLQVWRRSSPHNWFIEGAECGNYLWHSGEGYGRKLPDLSLFEKMKDSDVKILRYWGSDSGQSELSYYILKIANKENSNDKTSN